jgi:antibiotic biosynthesis monooxygenase (ABM) superfamily enzyme
VSPKPELPASAGPVTATVNRRVRPGHEEALAGLGGAARAFPGYLGEEVFRPPGGAGGEYRIIYRFGSPADLRSWLMPRMTALLRRWLYPDRRR